MEIEQTVEVEKYLEVDERAMKLEKEFVEVNEETS